jgi:formylglycine-generating enzyme required for sulfatase activity
MNKQTTTLGISLAIILGCFVRIRAQTPAASNPPAHNGAPTDKTYKLRDLKITLIRLEKGEFLMGSPNDETPRHDDETQHLVRLTKPFYIQTTELSQKQYEDVMGENPSYFKGADLPVENVTWSQAAAFCYELSRREGRRFRLPTEAEWEYAARAGKQGPIAGTGKLHEMAWYADNSGKAKLDSAKLWDTDPNGYFGRLGDNGCQTHTVGSGMANDWGLYDMQGNVSEWVGDWYSNNYFGKDAAKLDPPGPKKSELRSRVMRGGSWGSDPRNCRLARRDYNVPATQTASCGFRIVMETE